jgi:hypothetical protein
MIGLQGIAEFFAKEWQTVTGAPISFILAVLVVAAAVGVFFGYFVWQLRGWAAQSRIERLRAEKTVEDDVLEIVREKHEHEVEVREEIEAEFKRLHCIVERVHSGDTTSDQLITDATVATERAVEELKQAHEEFVQRMQMWDEQRFHNHRAALDHQN